MDLDDDAFDDHQYAPVANDDSADSDDGDGRYDDEDFSRSVAGNAGSYEDLDMEWINANGAALIERNRGKCAFEYRLDEYPVWIATQNPLTLFHLAEGKHSLTVRATIISSEAENTQERAADLIEDKNGEVSYEDREWKLFPHHI